MVSLYQEARAALRQFDFRPRKKLGQHFLVHDTVLEAIGQEKMLEIGPGLGFLTRRLVETAARVWAIEVDPLLAERLRQSPLGSHPAFNLIEGDVLKVSFDSFLPGRRVKLAANLPYSISTP